MSWLYVAVRQDCLALYFYGESYWFQGDVPVFLIMLLLMNVRDDERIQVGTLHNDLQALC